MLDEERGQLSVIYRLPASWDKNGANTIGFDAVLRTVEFITMIFCEYGRRPYLMVPTRTGGVSVEYRYEDSTIEVEINDRQDSFAYLIDLGPLAPDDNRYFIEENVPLENTVYRIGQVIGTLEEDIVECP